MDIALLTIWHVCNYGAELQTYATIKTLQEMGHCVKLIDLRLSDTYSKQVAFRVASFLSSFTPASSKFNRFWKRNFPHTLRYKSLSELKKNPPKADVYLVGSDQVWNPDITENLASAYFLDFGNESVRRVSYASSFGFSRFKNKTAFIERFSIPLKKFSALSCREQTGVYLLKEIGFNATNVLDPTLLRENYQELTGKLVEKKTLVYYPIGSNLSHVERFAKELALAKGLSFSNINKRTKIRNFLTVNCLSVEEWLKKLGESSLVVTTSFHGVAMSLIHKRQFLVVGTDSRRSSRITDLLTKLDLMDRYYPTVDLAKKAKAWDRNINYDIVSSKLDSLRKESFEFLIQALREYE